MSFRVISFISAIGLVLCVCSSITHPAELNVTKTADTHDGIYDADCSLREALTVAYTIADDDIINVLHRKELLGVLSMNMKHRK